MVAGQNHSNFALNTRLSAPRYDTWCKIQVLVYTQMLVDDKEGFICLLGLRKGKSIGGMINSMGSNSTYSRCIFK
jgi:hypothetical protein